MTRATTTTPTRRFLNTETAPVLATAHATVTGARAEGAVKGDYLEINLDLPKSLGGEGKYSNPEELFAAGYGACFQGAMNLAASQLKIQMPKKVDDSIIETDVHLVGDAKAADMGIRVDMKIKVKGVSQENLEKIVEKTRDICPYSRATKGNVTTNIEAISM